MNSIDILNEPADSVEPRSADSIDDSQELGIRLLRLRKQYGLSQRKLAQMAGVTNGSISMIEQNRVSPSVASLKKVLAVFDISLSEFFADACPELSKVFYRAHEMPRIVEERVVLRQVGSELADRKLQVLHETYAPGGDTGAEMLSHGGEESGVIVRGEIEVTVGGKCEVLGPGDSFYFDSRIPHRFRNLGTVECELVSACTPPSF